MATLFVSHAKKNSQISNDFLDAEITWETCIRKIAFHRVESDAAISPFLEVYQDEEAYEFLLQIICGLQSPVFGETEVLGQFRDFVSRAECSGPEALGFYQKLFSQLLADAKKVRTKYLKSIGSQSYGSMVRRLIGSERNVVILGAGQLAVEILPWLENQSQVVVKCRRPIEVSKKLSKQGLDKVIIQPWSYLGSKREDVVIVAAPISNQELKAVVPSAETLLDLRESYQSKGLKFDARCVHNLESFFSEFDRQSQYTLNLKQEVLSVVKGYSLKYRDQSMIRPFGWEDLCG